LDKVQFTTDKSAVTTDKSRYYG